MSKTYITLTGTQYYHGKDFLKPGMRVQLVKDCCETGRSW